MRCVQRWRNSWIDCTRPGFSSPKNHSKSSPSIMHTTWVRLSLSLNFSAGLSEDSDYTSEVNYPLVHQANGSASQYLSVAGQYPSPQRSSGDISRENSYEISDPAQPTNHQHQYHGQYQEDQSQWAYDYSSGYPITQVCRRRFLRLLPRLGNSNERDRNTDLVFLTLTFFSDDETSVPIKKRIILVEQYRLLLN